MSHNITELDAVIIGGGIAGLWTLACLKNQGLHCILLEKTALGAGQSMASQGIIHGGSKYALSGVISKATSNISQMPSVWQNALSGQAEVNLQGVKVLSQAQYLVPSSGMDSKLLSFLGSKTMASFTEKVKARNLPEAYQRAGIKQSCFKLNEMVIDTESLFKTFAKNYQDSIFQAEIHSQQIKETLQGVEIQLTNQLLKAKRLILAAGNGNQDLPAGAMQQRALKMVILKADHLPAIFAHFIGRSSKPLLTITSHQSLDNQSVWYLGGNLAEDGVGLSDTQQIEAAKQLLAKLLPEVKLEHADWQCLSINRAEPKQSSLLRPDDAFVERQGAIITGWPTKLALAPRFAEQVLEKIDLQTSITDAELPLLDRAQVFHLPWNSHD